jgi:hypothetical protein
MLTSQNLALASLTFAPFFALESEENVLGNPAAVFGDSALYLAPVDDEEDEDEDLEDDDEDLDIEDDEDDDEEDDDELDDEEDEDEEEE